MPARDTIHDAVVAALEKSDWTVTDDPLTVEVDGQYLFVDLGARSTPFGELSLFGAKRDGEEIAVEVKSFRGGSAMTDLHLAVG